jgi:hypothetical protein
MTFHASQFQVLRIHRSAINKYALQSVCTLSLDASHLKRIEWTQSASAHINSVRASSDEGMPPISPANLHAISLLSEAYLRMMSAYDQHTGRNLVDDTSRMAEKVLGSDELENLKTVFLNEFPETVGFTGLDKAHDLSLGFNTAGANADNQVQTMVMTWFHSINPAVKAFFDLFDLQYLSDRTSWNDWLKQIKCYWQTLPVDALGVRSLFDVLMQPIRDYPNSLENQLLFIAARWRPLLGEFCDQLLIGADFIREANKPIFGGPGPSLIPDYDMQQDEIEAYSADRDWMPELVLLAKNVYVWLEQLSKEYGRDLRTLNAVPDEALITLAKRGFNGLWLIGLWTRSSASRTIKKLCGNPEAAASAYSIYDYSISDDLGGEAAFFEFRDRAMKSGIRLAGDMVPNHMGIDSWWVYEHPDWFISVTQCPFSHYSFNGTDLSSHPCCSIFLEDHYYSRSDAAVVFKHVDHASGLIRYIYHGNDGTGLPWNDTAQLDYLQKNVREHVIQTIIDVARKFPIIRFDAAMTLAKQHFHRLWYPEPGSGGDIASRSWFGLSRSCFDQKMPTEFWRDVVEAISRHAPETLLLAEAFWLMEGYFVRTLGMHRVYNSAFMNMLRKEENQKYREVIKNTMAFDPEILKRYVNFMNNPDEEPAVIQFGKGDKYFGVCAMMSTLPGLPMFGHGQFEGYEEKYGMEYRRSYWNETVDEGLVVYHERIITPLLKKRRLFSGADRFRLYDFHPANDKVNENVFAYTNHADNEGMLFIFNNCNQSTHGTIHTSCAWREKKSSEEGELRAERLGSALSVSGKPDQFVTFFDVITRRWFIRNSLHLMESGFTCHLRPYQFNVYIGFHEIIDTADKKYHQVEQHLGGSGCLDIEEEWLDIQDAPFLQAARLFISDSILKCFDLTTRSLQKKPGKKEQDNVGENIVQYLEKPVEAFSRYVSSQMVEIQADKILKSLIRTAEERISDIAEYRRTYPGHDRLSILWHGIIQLSLKKILKEHNCDMDLLRRIWRLLEGDLLLMGLDEASASAAARLTFQYTDLSVLKAPFIPVDFFRQKDTFCWIRVNRYRGTRYFNREAFEELMHWGLIWGVLEKEMIDRLSFQARKHKYKYEEFLDALESSK